MASPPADHKAVDSRSTRVTVHLPRDLLARLDREVQRLRSSRSEVIARLVAALPNT